MSRAKSSACGEGTTLAVVLAKALTGSEGATLRNISSVNSPGDVSLLSAGDYIAEAGNGISYIKMVLNANEKRCPSPLALIDNTEHATHPTPAPGPPGHTTPSGKTRKLDNLTGREKRTAPMRISPACSGYNVGVPWYTSSDMIVRESRRRQELLVETRNVTSSPLHRGAQRCPTLFGSAV